MYKHLFLTLLACVFLISEASAQYISDVFIPDKSQPINDNPDELSNLLAQTITDYDMRMHLTILASDEFEGRETGEKGNAMAADYISKYFDFLGFEKTSDQNGFFQSVNLTFSKWEETEMHINGERYKHLWDYLSFPNLNAHKPTIQSKEVLYLGYGIDDALYSDYHGIDVAGKIILINKGEPLKSDSTSWISRSKKGSVWADNIDKKLQVAKEKGVELVLIIENDIKKMLSENRRKLLGSTVELEKLTDDMLKGANHAYISTTIAKSIIGEQSDRIIKARNTTIQTGEPVSITLPVQFDFKQSKKSTYLDGHNVLGYIEGSDDLLKDELVIISAHYDHLGKRGDDIYNGADDNGSGTTTVLELAEAFREAVQMGKGPKRSILFLLVTGEEKGLLGSQFYAERPVFPLEQTMVNINIDMVGRVDEKYTDNPNYVYVIGSDRLSTDLHKINEEVSQKYSHMVMDYTYNSEEDPNRYYYRSDHYNFAKNGIPAIFFFNGTHADYHKISDTVEKIDFTTMERRGRHIFHLAWELSNRDQKIKVDGEVR